MSSLKIMVTGGTLIVIGILLMIISKSARKSKEAGYNISMILFSICLYLYISNESIYFIIVFIISISLPDLFKFNKVQKLYHPIQQSSQNYLMNQMNLMSQMSQMSLMNWMNWMNLMNWMNWMNLNWMNLNLMSSMNLNQISDVVAVLFL